MSRGWFGRVALALVSVSSLFASVASAAKIDYLTPTPLVDRVKVKAQPVQVGSMLPVTVITWGADVQTVASVQDGTFKAEGLNVELFCENKFPKQVEQCLSGKMPYLRGTLGQMNKAAEVVKANGLELYVIELRSWSNGGDVIVARSNIRTPADLAGKTIALQLDGPHEDYVASVLTDAGVALSGVKFKWLEELTLPTTDTKSIIDPVSAFREDPSIDAVACIIPDGLALTSGGNVGDGSEGSVEGAHILLSTKTANRVIADVYAVRSDYYNSHRGEVEKFARALYKGEENWRDLRNAKDVLQAKYMQVISASAELLLGSSSATADCEAMVADAEMAGYAGNVTFFTGKMADGKETLRTLPTLNTEIQTAFTSMGLMKATVPLKAADWDLASFATGLKYATNVPAPKAKFDAAKVQASVSEKVAKAAATTTVDAATGKIGGYEVESGAWSMEGTLFEFEIYFLAKQTTFDANQVATAKGFQQALELAQKYGGSLIVIEGHTDPQSVLKAAKDKAPEGTINELKQVARSLSLDRAKAARDAFIAYCKSKGYEIDPSHVVVAGFGVTSPKHNPPTIENWQENRRVVFRVKQVEAELDAFVLGS